MLAKHKWFRFLEYHYYPGIITSEARNKRSNVVLLYESDLPSTLFLEFLDFVPIFDTFNDFIASLFNKRNNKQNKNSENIWNF